MWERRSGTDRRGAMSVYINDHTALAGVQILDWASNMRE
jgi:hypothetical protein